jgi:hypothetical protein
MLAAVEERSVLLDQLEHDFVAVLHSERKEKSEREE